MPIRKGFPTALSLRKSILNFHMPGSFLCSPATTHALVKVLLYIKQDRKSSTGQTSWFAGRIDAGKAWNAFLQWIL
ncbi:hypothetical protein EYC80_004712 [Monilinia laxa]|uniref:Uncharacterized protein n=1 Tax=Monilinia laxa TaxID=61186 RepID=A0A5N6KHL4_MONLA|nr:hypothetical protein EYC80_004712 [Monilinia laxa]